MISPIEIILLGLFGFAMFKCARGSCGRTAGFATKTIAVVAVLAGVWMIAARDHDRRDAASEVFHDVVVENLHLAEPRLANDFDPLGSDFNPLGDDFDPLAGDGPRVVHHSSTRVGMLILLGAGLIILGTMLFGRDKQRPFALKAITWLGIGAIIFAVANFFGEAPRADRVSHRAVERRASQVEEEHAARRPSRPGRAKRPSLRPQRPASAEGSSEDAELKLPPRAGSIPVEIEIAKAAAKVKAALEKAAEAKDHATEVVEAAQADAAEKIAEAQAKAEEKIAESRERAADVKDQADEVARAAKAEAAEKIAEAQARAEAKMAEAAANAAEREAEAKEPVAQPAAVAAAKPVAAEAQPRAVSETGGERPGWITAGPALVDGVYRITVSSGPWTSVPECQHALDEEVLAATNNYINEYLGNAQAASLVNISPKYLRQHVRKAEYAELVNSPAVGEMHQLYAQLAFDEQARADFERLWRNAVVEDRLWYIGGGATLVLALLATLYGYLKLELRTDAANRGRLQLAATLVALIVAAGALLARWTVAF